MEKILTAEELLRLRVEEKGINYDNWIRQVPPIVFAFAREFATIHVKEALKTALDETPYGSSTDTVSYEDCVHILDCYPPENIK